MRGAARTLGTLGLMALGSGGALAQEADGGWRIGGTVTLVSDYVFRGVSYSNGKPALQGEAYVGGERGPYLLLFASSLAEFSDGRGGSSSLEVGGQAGWVETLAATTLDAGLVYYDYPGASGVASWGTYLTASRSLGSMTGQVGVWYTPRQDSIRDIRTGEQDDSVYVRARLNAPIEAGWAEKLGEVSVSGSLGWHQGLGIVNVTSATDETGWDAALTFRVQRGAYAGSIGVIATDFQSLDGRGRDQAGTRLVASLGWSF